MFEWLHCGRRDQPAPLRCRFRSQRRAGRAGAGLHALANASLTNAATDRSGLASDMHCLSMLSEIVVASSTTSDEANAHMKHLSECRGHENREQSKLL